MDEPGYAARRRAELEARQPYAGLPETLPLPDEDLQRVNIPDHAGTTGFEVPNYRPADGTVHDTKLPGAISGGEQLQGLSAEGLDYKTAGPHKDDPAARRLGMQPHLQIMCGPMLRYDTVTPDKVWHGFALLVCSDNGSDYVHSKPKLRWQAGQPRSASVDGVTDQLASQTLSTDNKGVSGEVEGLSIYVFHGLHGANTFWRFKLEIPMQAMEVPITYSINHAQPHTFWVPGKTQNFRWIGHSCNGFSAGVKTEDFNGASPLWTDFLEKHAQKPYHVQVGGGDQLYCDPIVREPELSEWLTSTDVAFKIKHPLTDEMSFALNRFFFNHYCSWFRNGSFAKAMATVPALFMLDDHDVIDGFGTYPDDLQMSPVFSAIGSRGYFWFLLFQMFMVDEIDGSMPSSEKTVNSLILGGEGSYIPFPNHSFLSYLGPKQYILLLDCRSERKINRIVSPITYERVFEAISKLPDEVEHLTLLLGVPIAYPRMVFAEKILSSTFSPAKIASKLGMSGMENKFNRDAELLDDLNDHWCADAHKEERNWLVQECVKSSKQNRLRISYLSGDVHAGACGYFFSKDKIAPEVDPSYQINLISSAIVNTPPPPPMITLLNKLAAKTHKTLHHAGIDELMLPVFDKDTNGKSLNNKYIIGRRNYVLVEYNESSGELEWDLRVEKSQGEGTTVGYLVKSPAVKF